MFDGVRVTQFHSNEQKPQKASAADLSHALKTMGAPFLGRKFKLKIEQGTEVGVERENFRAHPSGVQNNEVQSLCINEPTLKIVRVVR